MNDRDVQGTMKFDEENIIVWGYMGGDGFGKLTEVEGKMNADWYMNILDNYLLPSMEE